jgi:predicted enzyme related to lactoylglutathione lyase
MTPVVRYSDETPRRHDASVELTFSSVTIDCADCRSLARFWHDALGWTLAYDADDGAYLENPLAGGPGLFLQPVPEPKTTKNRAHMDLTADDLDAVVTRIGSLGATVQRCESLPDGRRYAVLQDPESNEFCVVERSPTA